MSSNYCINCDKIGHIFKECNKPITSYGILCFNINSRLNINNSNIETLFYNKFTNICDYNYNKLNNLKLLKYYNNDIKILMIQRKHSLTYIEFIRGKYDINNKTQIKNLLKLMTINENNNIKTQSFEYLWNILWINTASHKTFRKEFLNSQVKFDFLKNNNFYNLFDSQLSIYIVPEWGFPKGRKEQNEKYIDCAIREFTEETNIHNIHLLNRINYIDENYIGSNNLNYRNIYYLAHSDIINSVYNEDHTYEVGDMKWLSYKDCCNIIRPYDLTKKKILNNIYFFIVNLIEYHKFVKIE